MGSRHHVFSLLIFLGSILLSGCGGSSGQPGTGSGNSFGSVSFTNANLTGLYAFFFTGDTATGFFAAAGSFQANGSGTLSNGLLDINSSTGVLTNVPFSGNYNVSSNGQGTASLVTTTQTFNLRIVLITNDHALIGSFGNSNGQGSLNRQDSTAFSVASVQGQFAFNLLGIDASGNPLASVGGFNASAGVVTSGLHDVNNGTPITNQPLSGTYTVAANGRGTLTLNTALGTLHFAFYVVDRFHLKLVETERSPALGGEISAGHNGGISTPGCGPCVFVWNGLSGAQRFAAIGTFSVDDIGGIGNTSTDKNVGGIFTQGGSVGGNYSFAPNFRGTATLGTGAGALTFAIYPNDAGVLMLQIDPGNVISGLAVNEGLAGTPHLDLTFDGAFGFNFVGFSFNSQMNEIGQLITSDPGLNGTGPITGAVDIMNGSTVSTGLALSGSFTMDKTAKGTLNIQTSSGAQHFALRSTGTAGLVAFFVSTDSTPVAAGMFWAQPENH